MLDPMRRFVWSVLCIAVAGIALDAAVVRERTGRRASASVAPSRPAGVPKVVMVGDSLMGEVAAAMAAAVGGDRAEYVLTIGTANVKDDWWDVWPRVITQHRPDAVAVLVGPWELNQPDLGTYPWALWYSSRLDRWADQLTASGADLYWILPPSVRDAEADRRMTFVRVAYRDLAARRSDVHIIDADDALAGGRRYVERTSDGQRLRRIDGLHLCPLGAEAIVTRLLATMGVEPTKDGWATGPWRTSEPAYSSTECPA